MQNFQQLLQVYLEPCEIFTLEFLYQNISRLLPMKNFRKNAAPEMFHGPKYVFGLLLIDYFKSLTKK